MSKYLKHVFFVLFASALLLEVLIRIFSMAGHTMEERSVNGDRLFVPGTSGKYVRGGLKEIDSYYEINRQGWNSVRDYERDSSSNIRKIAIVGDSYIEGLVTDVRKSIGRIMEAALDSQYVIHEFGRSGGNLADYLLLYEKYNLDKYDYVFIRFSYDDIYKGRPAFVNQGGLIPKETLARKTYNASALLRYLNINHGLGQKIFNLISRNKQEKGKKSNVDLVRLAGLSAEMKSTFGNNTVIFYDSSDFDSSLAKRLDFPSVAVSHELQPIDHGFDGHWNLNGRTNVAKTLADYVRDHEADEWGKQTNVAAR